MLPLQIERRFKNPGELERDFLAYLADSNAPINQSKSIASNVLYHGKDISTLSSIDFFSGTFISSDTNVVGNFVRPESEHFLIYAIRFYTSSIIGAVSAQEWIRGNNLIGGPMYNATITITENSIRLLKRIPITEFEGSLTTKDQGTLFLDEPILWQGQTELKLSLQAADGDRFNPNSFARLDLVGIGLI